MFSQYLHFIIVSPKNWAGGTSPMGLWSSTLWLVRKDRILIRFIPVPSARHLLSLCSLLIYKKTLRMSDWKELAAREERGGSLHTNTAGWEQKCSLKTCLFAYMIDLSLKARGLQLYITISRSGFQPVILWSSDWAVQSAGAEGLAEESWKMPFFYSRSTRDVSGNHGDVLSDLFSGSSMAPSYFTGQRWKA